MRNHEQPQPLLITRQTNDRRGCRLVPVRKEVKQAWLNAAYAGIESLKEIGTRDDFNKLREIYTEKVEEDSSGTYSQGGYDNIFVTLTEHHTFPNAPRLLRQDLEYSFSGEIMYDYFYESSNHLSVTQEEREEKMNSMRGHRVIRETIAALKERFPDTDIPQQQ